MTSSSLFSCDLPDLAVIEIAGQDAPAFLQGQLTHDVASLPPDRARLNGYCTPKGRLLASLVLWRDGRGDDAPRFLALIKQDIADAIVKRLGMYILRAKVAVKQSDLSVRGVMAATPADGGIAADRDLPADATPWQLHQDASRTAIAAPSVEGFARWWTIGAKPDAATAAMPAPLWQAHDIAAGLPWIVTGTQDTFIPQTVNLELIDGVSFTKGCYPGQEVVARSHYRGTLKRRMVYGVIADAATLPEPGSDTYDARHPDGPCGRIVNAARAGRDLSCADGGAADQVCHVLMEAQLSDLGTADFRAGQAGGPSIAVLPLPYGLQSAA
ncbi:MAG: folate-binding protein [Candidimonas sp.]|jgi:folate-binding protein YgfZ